MIKKILIQVPSFFFKKLESFKNSQFLKFISSIFKRNILWILAGLIGIALADLTLLFLFPLPEQGLTPAQVEKKIKTQKLSSNYIESFNFFHRGEIPPSLNSISTPSIEEFSNENSSQSRLPYTLLGTIESSNPEMSMASILNTSTQESQSYFVGDIVDEIAQIISVERRKVTFLNLRTNQVEHIEIPFDKEILSLSNPLSPPPQEPLQTPLESNYPGIEKTGENQYSVNRSTTNDHLKNLTDILQQARVVPKYSEDGRITGHTFSWIQEGSVYEGLGFKKGDTILSINGEMPGEQSEATELFQKLRTTSQFNIVVEKEDGNVDQLSYDIREDASIQ